MTINEEVMRARSNMKWRREYMLLSIELDQKFREGRIEGRAELLSIIRYLNTGHSAEETSEKFDISIDEIYEIIKELNI